MRRGREGVGGLEPAKCEGSNPGETQSLCPQMLLLPPGVHPHAGAGDASRQAFPKTVKCGGDVGVAQWSWVPLLTKAAPLPRWRPLRAQTSRAVAPPRPPCGVRRGAREGGGGWHKAWVVGSVGLWRRLLASRP